MKILYDTELCNGCHACFSACPKNAITMESDGEGFLFPRIDSGKCNNCGLCRKTCPMNKTQTERTGKAILPKAFLVINKNDVVRMDSSSGGAFTAFAECVINEGGVVFGARFNEKFEVVHDYTETTEELAAFRRSKYVQSRIGDTYKQVQNLLTEKRKVLFSGTPCQIGGLKSYLQKDYENLICVDFICFGVPSPKLWKKYLKYREKIEKSDISGVTFRPKIYGYKEGFFRIILKFANDAEVCLKYGKDLFLQTFFSALSLRKSCYCCGFKTAHRISDITLADEKRKAYGMYDNKGLSLVLCQSSKGYRIFEKVADKLIYRETDCEEQIKGRIYNKKISRERRAFMNDIDKFEFDKLVSKYLKFYFFRRVLRYMKRMRKKFSNKLSHGKGKRVK